MNLASPRYLFREKASPRTKAKSNKTKKNSSEKRIPPKRKDTHSSSSLVVDQKNSEPEKNQEDTIDMSYVMEQLRIDLEQIKLDFNQFYKIMMKQMEDQDMRLRVLEDFCR